MNIKYYKRYIEKLIDASPAEITITRKIKTDDGYGGKEISTVILPPQRVRFYNKKSIRENVEDKGVLLVSGLKMLTPATADIKEDDMFASGGKTLRVAFLGEYMGVCYQAELEVVK